MHDRTFDRDPVLLRIHRAIIVGVLIAVYQLQNMQISRI